MKKITIFVLISMAIIVAVLWTYRASKPTIPYYQIPPTAEERAGTPFRGSDHPSEVEKYSKTKKPFGLLKKFRDEELRRAAGKRSCAEEVVLKPWIAEASKIVTKGHKKAFIHFTGDGCLDCHVQWALVNKQTLAHSAKFFNVDLYEANLKPSQDNSFILSELQKYGLGGVPGYVFIDSKGIWHVLKDRLWSEDKLVKTMISLP